MNETAPTSRPGQGAGRNLAHLGRIGLGLTGRCAEAFQDLRPTIRTGRTPTTWTGFALGLGLLGSSCSGHATQGDVSIFGGAPPSYDYINDGPVVAKVRVLAPVTEDFILQATIPLPPGTYDRSDALVPFAILSSSPATASPSQVEIVSRYPNPDHGADVVEVSAHVRRPPVAPGTPIDYEVVFSPHTAQAFVESTEVAALFDEPGKLVLEAKDVFGHRYNFDVLASYRAGTPERVRSGAIMHEHKTSGALMPTTVVSGTQATLPHLMGVHAYMRRFTKEDFFALDLHLHNGFDGQDPSTTADDVLDELHFERLSLRLPAGWRVIDTLPNPYLGVPTVSGGNQSVDLVAPLPGNKLHFMPRSSQFWRRLYIARDASAEARAQVHVARHNIGFCQPGETAGGVELWSWWNQLTARYSPLAFVLPHLDSMATPEAIREEHRLNLENRLAQVATGSASGYPVLSPGLGWSHPWGVAYGGMTGGDDITQTPGIDVAWAASPDGLRFHELKARMVMDRQPGVFYRADGEPTCYEDLVVPQGNYGPWMPLEFTMRPTGFDYFGFGSAPMHQAQSAQQQNRLAPYKQALADYQPIDLQHYVRYSSHLIILAWLANDSLAKEQLEQSAELYRMTHHEAYVGNYGYVPGAGLKSRELFLANHQGVGIAYGRGEAWGLQLASAAYALGDDTIRGRYKPWLRTVANYVHQGQSTCTGNIASNRIGNVMNGQYLTRQSFELAFMVTALESMRRSVFEGSEQTTAERLHETMIAATYSTVTAPFWDSSIGGQRRRIGVGRSDFSQVDFCTSIPFEAFYNENEVDNLTAMTPWGLAYAATQDPIFLQRAAEILPGNGHVMEGLGQLGVGALGHHGPFLAALQRFVNQ